ncbi:MAG: NHL repeat-containing protein, partial [Chloroflexi bacterium]|nr:NHL repeat-containing protein [Chloroflexota bacterium]
MQSLSSDNPTRGGADRRRSRRLPRPRRVVLVASLTAGFALSAGGLGASLAAPQSALPIEVAPAHVAEQAVAPAPPAVTDLTRYAESWQPRAEANGLMAMGGGAPNQGYYTYIDSDEPASPPAVVPPTFDFKDIRFGSTVAVLGDDACIGPLPLSGGGDRPDFQFTYFDSNVASLYTEAYVCSNGQVSFGAPYTTFTNSCPVGGGAAGGQIHAYWDDLDPSLGSSARVLYKTIGSVPFRTFIVQWEQVGHHTDPADNVIVQLQLEEFTDDIRIEYFNVQSGAPDGLALSPTGDILAGSSVGDKVLRYGGGSGFSANHVRSGEGGLDAPAGLAYGNGVVGDAYGDFDGDGVDDVYVASSAGNEILVYSGATGTGQINDGSLLSKLVTDLPATPGDDTGGLDTPRGVVFGPDGSLYVASFGTNSVKRYDASSGLYLGDFVTAGLGGLSGPDSLVFAGSSLFVSSFSNDRILRYNAATGALIGTFVAAGAGGLDGPRGMAFGPDGNLYVASENTDQVLRYLGSTGAYLGPVVTAGQAGLDRPRGLVFGPPASPASATELYVAGFGSN